MTAPHRSGFRAATLSGALAAALVAVPALGAQQLADTTFRPVIASPAFGPGTGPRVAIDEAHHNFHTVSGRYAPFARVLRADGFQVTGQGAPFSAEALRHVQILVVANALGETGPWVLPTRTAFTADEIRALETWVRGGGSLLFIADHMPFPGAAESLAAAFGLVFYNGFAMTATAGDPPLVFRRSSGLLHADIVTDGRGPAERIDSVVTFTGQGFRATRPVRPLLTLDSNVTMYLPQRAWEFTPMTVSVSARGLLQAAVFRHGRGRVAVFGEAAMFSAQRQAATGRTMGMNSPAAPQNMQLLLNVVRWLAGVLEPGAPPSH